MILKKQPWQIKKQTNTTTDELKFLKYIYSSKPVQYLLFPDSS